MSRSGGRLVQLVGLFRAARAQSFRDRPALEPRAARLTLVRFGGHPGLDAGAQPLYGAQFRSRDERSPRPLPLCAPREQRMSTAAAHSRLPMALADLAFREYHSAQLLDLAPFSIWPEPRRIAEVNAVKGRT